MSKNVPKNELLLSAFMAHVRWFLANKFNDDLIVILKGEMIKRGVSMGALNENVKIIKEQLGIKDEEK